MIGYRTALAMLAEQFRARAEQQRPVRCAYCGAIRPRSTMRPAGPAAYLCPPCEGEVAR